MYRARFILSVISLLLVLQTGIIFWQSWTDGKCPLSENPLHIAQTGVGMAAAILGAVGYLHLHRAFGSVGRQLSQNAELRRLWPVQSSHRDVQALEKGVNQTVEMARQAVSDAALRVKELEIELKVADAERRHAQAIIYSISDAVLVTDPFNELVMANDAAARTFNFNLDAAHRAPVDQILQDPKLLEMIHSMREGGSATGRRVVEHETGAGAGKRTYKITLSCVNGPGNQAAGVVAVMHDITREREIAAMKNDFVSSVSHELRTPLASIKAYTEMLIDGEAEDEKTVHEFHEVIQSEANRLGRLIDNILNISRIESGVVKINRQPQSLMVLVKEAIEVISPQARQKNIEVQEQLPPAIYQTLADRDMIYQVILNLLSNAVKYTQAGGRITVQTVIDEQKKRLTTLISDTGAGISPKDLPFVFDKFYRAESHNRMAHGTGLGLALVKHIIETVHQGRVFVESQVGKGSTFGFELDLV